MIVLWLGLSLFSLLEAQTETNSILANPGQTAVESTNAVPIAPMATPSTDAALPVTNEPAPAIPVTPATTPQQPANLLDDSDVLAGMINTAWILLTALIACASLGGFLLYYTGLTRAKNCGHTSVLLLAGVIFGVIGFWMSGFAVQTGGGGFNGTHGVPGVNGLVSHQLYAFRHELGFRMMDHYWGLMGSSGYFLVTETGFRHLVMLLFLSQAALLSITVAAALGAALERGKLIALAIGSFITGAFIYPLLANWTWGEGWLARLGHEYSTLDLGHGFVDWAGAGVVHQTAGTLALVIALILGPRHGRFGRDKISRTIPGHNIPFVILGAVILLLSWTTVSASAGGTFMSPVAAVNTLLAAASGLLISFFLAAALKRRPDPALLCRGLLGGAVASCGCSGLIDPGSAFVIGAIAALLVQAAVSLLEKRRVDDPVGVVAVHGVGGAWGVIATGIFANGTAGMNLNGVDGTVRGLLFGGAWHQLAAQVIGCVTGFVVVFILGYAFLTLIQKILGLRVDLVEETEGLDWTQVGAMGYQGDIEPEK